MKKVISLLAAVSVVFTGLVVASPAQAAGTGNPTFSVTSYDATEGVAFNAHLNPTFNNPQTWMVWGFGSRAFLNTTDCQALPTGLSFVEEGFEASAGIAPTYNIIGTPAEGTAGVYSICFNTESNEEGWYSVGTSEVVTLTVGATPPVVNADYTIDCQDLSAQGAPYTNYGQNGEWYGSRDVNFDGTQTQNFTVRIKGCGYTLKNDVNGVVNDYVGTGTDYTFNVTVPVNGYADLRGYNTWDAPASTTFIINFYNTAPAPPGEATNDVGWDLCEDGGGTRSDYSTNNLLVSSICSEGGRISDVDTANTDDAFDGFGLVEGVNWDDSTWAISSNNVITAAAGVYSYKQENMWSTEAQAYVDILVTRTVLGNTITWKVEVFLTGTTTPANLEVIIRGNLGSDDNTVWTTSNGYTVSHESADGDPILIWNPSSGTIEGNTLGSDSVKFNLGVTSSATLEVTIVGYESCPVLDDVLAYVDTITADYANKKNTDIAEAAGGDCGGGTPAITLTADSTTLSEGQSTGFTTNADANAAAALFIDANFIGSGTASTVGSIVWSDFGDCEAHVVTFRIYDATFSEQTYVWSDSYAATIDINLNAGTTGECAPVPPTTVDDVTNPTGGFSTGTTVTINGANLEGMTKLIINGVEVPFTNLTGGGFSFVIPAGLAVGVYDLVIEGTFGTVTKAAAITIKATFAQESKSKTVGGFALNSTVITKSMKAKIKAWVKSNPKGATYSITGYTSGPIFKTDYALAKARAKAVKAYILSLDKTAKFTAVKGTPDKRKGSHIRRVLMKATYDVQVNPNDNLG